MKESFSSVGKISKIPAKVASIDCSLLRTCISIDG